MINISPDFFFILFEYLYVFAIGTILGSFTTAVIYRSQNNLSYIFGITGKAARSKCAKCGHVLKAKDLVPIFSWVWRRGRCRYCNEKISAFYPIIEVTSALIALTVFCFFSIFQTLVLLISMPFWVSFSYRLLFDKSLDKKLLLTAIILSFASFVGFSML